MTIFLLCVTAYMIGSIPFGLLITRAAGLGDIRAMGSGNIGATNVLRTGHTGLAAATLALDALKGTAVVLFVQLYDDQVYGLLRLPGALPGTFIIQHAHGGISEAALCVFLGHLYPFWLGFKGGKGVATALGVFAGLCWPLGLFCSAVWLLVAALFRRSSVAALTAFALAPFAAWHFSSWQTTVLSVVIGAFVFWSHRGNIQRLRAGTEPKIGAK